MTAVILLLPALALFRIASHHANVHGAVARWLLAGVWLALLTPTWAFYGLGTTALYALHAGQAALWLVVPVFLVMHVRTREPSVPDPAFESELLPIQEAPPA